MSTNTARAGTGGSRGLKTRTRGISMTRGKAGRLRGTPACRSLLIQKTQDAGGRRDEFAHNDVCAAAKAGAGLIISTKKQAARRDAAQRSRAREPFSSLYLFNKSGSMPCMRHSKRDGGEGKYQADIKRVSSRNKGPWNFVSSRQRATRRPACRSLLIQ